MFNKLFLIAINITFLSIIKNSFCYAQCTSTANFVHNGTASVVPGVPNWNNPNNILTNDATNASYSFTCTTPPCTTGTNPASLILTGTFPTLPANAVVCGLTVFAYGSISSPGGTSTNYTLEVRLLNNGVQIGRKFAPEIFCFPLFGCGGYGGASELWGNSSLSVADLTSGNFAFSFVPNINMPSTTGTASISVNYVVMRLNYSIPTTTPVSLINFDVKSTNNGLAFYWSAQEDEMDYYEIEYKDGEKWQTLSTITSRQNGYQEYEEFINTNLENTLVRLKAVDKLGEITYSNNKEVFSSKEIILIKHNNKLEIDIAVEEMVKLYIYSFDGKQVQHYNLEKETNLVDISTLNSGVYYVRIETENDLKTFKIIKD